MIAVLFEVWPMEGQEQQYFNIAADLRPRLDEVDGFISVERFESLSSPRKFLSLSFWRDEEAVVQWRKLEQHRLAQVKGRTAIFQDYRLQVATVLRDYGMVQREQAPHDSQLFHK